MVGDLAADKKVFIIEEFIAYMKRKRLSNHSVLTLGFVFALALVAFVIAQTTPNPGHDASEIGGIPDCNAGEYLTKSGGTWNCVPDSTGGGGTPVVQIPGGEKLVGLQTLQGEVQITWIDLSGSDERCWFKVLLDGRPWIPNVPCSGGTCQQSINFGDLDYPEQCYNYIQYLLKTELSNVGSSGSLDFLLGLPGVNYYNIKNFNFNVPNAAGVGWLIQDGTFDFEYAISKTALGDPVQLSCPSSCDVHYANGWINYQNTCTPTNPSPTTVDFCCTLSQGWGTGAVPGLGCFPDFA